jgi:hypothetical protein
MRKSASKENNSRSSHAVPYISEFERLVLSILKDDLDNKEQIRELLEEYATRYAEKDTSEA